MAANVSFRPAGADDGEDSWREPARSRRTAQVTAGRELGRIGLVMIQHKRPRTATGALRAAERAKRWRRSGSSSARNVSESAVCAREERPRGVGEIECEQALGDLLEDVPVRLAEHVELARSASCSRGLRRRRRARGGNGRSTSGRPERGRAARRRGTRRVSARRARSPRSRRLRRVAPSPCCSSSEPIQRRAPGSSERQASSIARSFHSQPASPRSTMPSMCAASTASASSPVARARSQAARKSLRPRPSRAGGVRHAAALELQAHAAPRDRPDGERPRRRRASASAVVEAPLQPARPRDLRQHLREEGSALLDPGPLQQLGEAALAPGRVVEVPQAIELVERDGRGIPVHCSDERRRRRVGTARGLVRRERPEVIWRGEDLDIERAVPPVGPKRGHDLGRSALRPGQAADARCRLG